MRPAALSTLLVLLVVAFPSRGQDAGPPVVRLESLVQEALRNHPVLQRARHEARARWQVPSRVGSPPDPVFSVAAQNIRFDEPGLTTSPMSAIQFGLLQPMPYPGKLAARRDAASAIARAADREVELHETRIALAVERAYWQLSYAEDAVRISEQSERVINSLTDAVHARFSVAQAAQQDALQAQVAHSRLRAELTRRKQEASSAQRTLNAAVGREPAAAFGWVARPPASARKLDRKELARRMRRSNPALAHSRAQVYAAKSAVEAAKEERWPDFHAGFMYRFRLAAPGDMSEGADMFGVVFGMTLPVWMSWKQNAGVREAIARCHAADENVSDVTLAMGTELARAVDEVERLDAEIRLYEKEVLPQADAALDASIEDYAFARIGFVSLLQNWRAELDARLVLSRLRADRAVRLAEIEAIVGGATGGTP